MNNNLDINLNPIDSLNSINNNSNQHRESFPYQTDKIRHKVLQQDGVEMVVMMVLVVEMMVMMIPMMVPMMVMAMATISPLREGISPADFSLPESFSLSVVFRPVAAAEYFLDALPPFYVFGTK